MAPGKKTHPAPGTASRPRPDWNNLAVLHRNTLPPRANFHVYNSLRDALAYDTAKARTHSLSGSWNFHHAVNPFEAPMGFEDPSFRTEGPVWHLIPVPSMWQLHGYGRGPQYTNVNFPVPVDPPNVPLAENETASYVRRFVVPGSLRPDGDGDEAQIRLRFEGVDAAYHVWVNGREVGYHQGSRNPAEFDITDVLNPQGENTLAVRVYQYCDATYIEDQDQWRMSGIYRDVHLLGFPAKSRIEDLFIQTKLDSQYVNADLKVRVDVTGSGELKLELYDPEKKSIVVSDTRSVAGGDGRTSVDFSLPVENPHKWTAETPTLYHLVVSLDGTSFVSQRVGFRQVEMKDGLIKVNGKRIVLKGANRHEHHPEFGRAVPYEFMKRDLMIMKNHNINAIRTCHQPSDVRLYDLADELGFWVMDEADLECHGFESICDAALSESERELPFRQRQLLTRDLAAKWTSDNGAWEDAYVDRAIQLVRRDQLHPSVIIWSLGNEAFFGRNHKAMYKWIKSYDDSRPIHYEADIHAETADMYSRMYPPVEEIIDFGKDESKTKPLVLCEYIHAMGNGPGNIKEYIDAFYAYPKLQGGFVWEWANHGLLTKDAATGEPYYGYGGDFDDEPNDGNFVMDGMLFSDHTPTPGLIEYKKGLEPVKVVASTPQKATIVNRYDFITLDHLKCSYVILDEGEPTSQAGTLEIPAGVQPGATFELALPSPSGALSGEGILQLSFQLRSGTAALPADFEVAFAEIPLNDGEPVALLPSLSLAADAADGQKLTVTETPPLLVIVTPTTRWTFSTVRGQILSWTKHGVPFLAPGDDGAGAPAFTAYRAPTDNDAPQDGRDWHNRLLHLARAHTTSCTWDDPASPSPSPSPFTVEVHQRFAPPVLSWSLDLDLTYSFWATGRVAVRVRGQPRGANLPRTLPRLGLTMELAPAWGDGAGPLRWYGRGPGESYADSKLAQRAGVHRAPRGADDLWTDYEFPQECGNRTDTRWVEVSAASEKEQERVVVMRAQFRDLEGKGVREDGDGETRRLFDFSASHYRARDVERARHPFELRRRYRTDNVVLRLDAAHHGLGSGSCGPKTRDEYALRTAPFEFEVVMG
ncbi:intracellular beta-galactosidase BgaD [Biscogniauxia mediterranea]|nr:intracellular beta-galactosidase BgaD [Biscogniauxia mediterranea]